MAGKSSLKQIAEKSGVSMATVSQILNNRSQNYSSEETKRRVRMVAEELGYQVNFGYKLMRGQKTKTVAILNSMPEMNFEEYVLKLTMLLISGFDKLGYSAYCHAFSLDPAVNLEKVRILINRGVEHFVFLGSPFGYKEILRELERYKLPAISNSPNFERQVDRGTKSGSLELLRYFQSQVGENYKLICQEREATIGNRKLQAMVELYPEKTLDEIIRDKVFLSDSIEFEVRDYGESAYPVGYEATKRLLEQEPGIGAIVYMNDSFAVGGGRFLLQPGNEKFHHILLGGCNNEHAIRNFPLPISSIAFDLEGMAEQLVRNALTNEPCHIIAKTFLHIRTMNPGGRYPAWTETVTEVTP